MEGAALIAETFLLCAQATEIFGSAGANVGTQLNDNPANHGIADFDIKVDLRIFARFLVFGFVALVLKKKRGQI